MRQREREDGREPPPVKKTIVRSREREREKERERERERVLLTRLSSCIVRIKILEKENSTTAKSQKREQLSPQPTAFLSCLRRRAPPGLPVGSFGQAYCRAMRQRIVVTRKTRLGVFSRTRNISRLPMYPTQRGGRSNLDGFPSTYPQEPPYVPAVLPTGLPRL